MSLSGLLLALGALARPAAGSAVSLVGFYDTSALLATTRTAQSPRLLWRAAPGMSGSCGPAKAPDGLGLFEAETFANGDAPALGILLALPEGSQELNSEQVRISLGVNGPEFRLQPAVSPRALAVSITGQGALRHKQLVRTQLEMELCMEHKVGRGWIGGDALALRQAFLLDPPAVGGPDRKAFGGQSQPVPALLGAPDACLRREDGLEGGVVGGQGEGSLDLVPSDVWGASLRWCGPEETGGAAAGSLPPLIPLHLSGEQAPRRPRVREALDVVIGAAEADLDVRYDLRFGDRILADQAKLFSPVAASPGEAPSAPGIQDLLASLPYDYPVIESGSAAYALLLIPNWQVAEGLRRIKAEKLAQSMGDGGAGVLDAVGEVLAAPELLFVQVPGAGGDWVNLSGTLTGEPLGLRSWGFTTGMLSARAPLALPGSRPTLDQVAEAHRAGRHSLFLGSAALLLGLGWLGMRRLRDLWTPSPVERVAYWPNAEGELPESSPPPVPGKP